VKGTFPRRAGAPREWRAALRSTRLSSALRASGTKRSSDRAGFLTAPTGADRTGPTAVQLAIGRRRMRIKQAQTKTEIEEIRSLFREYEAFLDVDLCFQSPSGDLLIGLDADRIVGCVAVRKLDDGVCEMKRLYVRPEARGTGLGRQLAQAIIVVAKELGYSIMRLDTLDSLKGAMHLYEMLGFRTTGPYYENPLPGVVYWELDLKEEGIGQQDGAPNADKRRR